MDASESRLPPDAARRDAADLRRLLAQAESRHAVDKSRWEAALAAAHGTIALYERSRSWRLTAPLRAIISAVRSLRRRSPPPSAPPRPIVPPLTPRAALAPAIGALAIPASETPRVSVLIPTFAHPLHLFTCLAAIAGEARAVALEVIVVDDHGPVAARDALGKVTGVRFERNDQNLGYLKSCNRAAALASGEFVLFLNDDAVVAPGALQALLKTFADDPRAGAAGAKLIYPDGRLQEAGAIVWRDGSAWNYGRGDDPARPEYNYRRRVDYCSAACLMVRRTVFRDLGGFDERFVPAYCEDTDLCFRVREAGLRVYYQPAAEATHFEGVSHGRDASSEGAKRYQLPNQAKFRARWSAVLAGHRPAGMLARLERDRDARRRILFIEEGMLTPDEDSGSLRTFRLLQQMRALGSHVTFVPETLEAGTACGRELQQRGIEVLHSPYLASIEEILEERGTEFDMVVLARHAVAARHIESVRRHAPGALLVFDTLDLHHRRAAVQEAARIRAEELDCVRRCDATWVVSTEERDLLAAELPGCVVHVQTNIHSLSETVAPFGGREGLVFAGNYRHPPNVDAALWLCREIWPFLRQALPGVPLRVAGTDPPEAVRALGGDGIEVVGHVPDLESLMDRSRVALSPLRFGAGVKGKINHAMSRGLPVVATPLSIEGMHLVPGEDVLIAEGPEAFAEVVARLYRDEALWNALSMGGRANVERHFSPQVAAASLQAFFDWADARLEC
jgi:O-antigen biosynthesis protein